MLQLFFVHSVVKLLLVLILSVNVAKGAGA